MDSVHLLTAFDGRIPRTAYWMGWLHVAGVAIVLGMTSLFIVDVSTPRSVPLRLFQLAVNLALLFPLTAIFVKRLHDRDKSGSRAVLPISLLAVSALMQFFGPSEMPRIAALAALVAITVTLIVLAWFMIELGFMRGTQGPNRYGPDPLVAS